jgi:hypothetical protein
VSRGGSAAGIPLLVVGGLTLAGATTATWVRQEVTRTIADVPVTDVVTTAGVEFAPFALPLGIAAAAMGVLLLALRGRSRRASCALAAAAGVGAAVDVVRGAFGAAATAGDLTSAPGAAGVGAALIVAGAVLAAGSRRRPGLPDRFDIDRDAPQDEWTEAIEPNGEDS